MANLDNLHANMAAYELAYAEFFKSPEILATLLKTLQSHNITIEDWNTVVDALKNNIELNPSTSKLFTDIVNCLDEVYEKCSHIPEKLTIVDAANIVYGTAYNGDQTYYHLDNSSVPNAGDIPKRNSNGHLLAGNHSDSYSDLEAISKEYLTSYIAENALLYSGATQDVDLTDAYKLYFGTNHYLGIYDDNFHIVTGSGNIVLSPDEKAFYGSPDDANNEIAKHSWVTSTIASALTTVKSNAFIVVDTEDYPTLESFLNNFIGEEGYIYLYPSPNENDGYYQYIWELQQWLSIGTTKIDLSDYYQKDEVDDIIDDTKASVPKYQVETIFIVDALTNINGRAFQNYTSTEVTIGGYTGLKILKNGNTVTEAEAKEYMEYMTGSYYLPKYNYDKPKNTYFITPNGHVYKPQYDSTNGLVLYNFGDLATKAHADTKVSKTNSGEKVYGTDELGAQMTYDVDSDLVGSGAIVRRETITGTVVVGTPTSNTHATTKKYVDDSIASAVSAAYRYKGTKTVAQINALTGMVTGDVYNVSDSGTLTEGSVQVIAGDNVAWTGTEWDKLANDIDWDTYNETFMAAGFIQAGPVDSVPEQLTFDSEGNITNPDWTGNIALDYMSPPISDISISDVPATLTFDVTQDYDNMITNADWTGIMTITY